MSARDRVLFALTGHQLALLQRLPCTTGDLTDSERRTLTVLVKRCLVCATDGDPNTWGRTHAGLAVVELARGLALEVPPK